jgi:hypothetical protein
MPPSDVANVEIDEILTNYPRRGCESDRWAWGWTVAQAEPATVVALAPAAPLPPFIGSRGK